ncbi:hypothetical protein NE237_003419 [Protea cynaroides]|uniref:LYK4/5 third LysM domain-containing protein n=1 Tax=Protea cynaroides TaxID=273540 RepID=A0A9Q0QSK3_9MAGN|nr:hypothetical protein NE237_003419 [Protea cynaroides]
MEGDGLPLSVDEGGYERKRENVRSGDQRKGRGRAILVREAVQWLVISLSSFHDILELYIVKSSAEAVVQSLLSHPMVLGQKNLPVKGSSSNFMEFPSLSSFLHFYFLLLSYLSLFLLSGAQQSYLDDYQINCYDNNSVTSGYLCNGPQRSCSSYLTFRSTYPYDTPLSIGYLLASNASLIAQVNNMSEMFGVDEQSINNANNLTFDSDLFPFTPILVPLNIEPTMRNIALPPPLPPPPPVSPTPPVVPAGATTPMAKGGCKEICGNISIPYPFGIGNGCYFDRRFEILWSESNFIPSVPFLQYPDVEVLEFLPDLSVCVWSILWWLQPIAVVVTQSYQKA